MSSHEKHMQKILETIPQTSEVIRYELFNQKRLGKDKESVHLKVFYKYNGQDCMTIIAAPLTKGRKPIYKEEGQ